MVKRKASHSIAIAEVPVRLDSHAVKNKKQRQKESTVVEDVNGLILFRFEEIFMPGDCIGQHIDFGGREIEIFFTNSSLLCEDDLNTCFALIESSSRKHYESSSRGWRPLSKKREMLDKDMKYLLVQHPPLPLDNDDPSVPESNVEGFLSFMITYDSMPAVPVLYVFEIHLSEPFRRIGLGAYLMGIVEETARRIGVEKVILTCFLANEVAHKFYRRLGYTKDASSPDERCTRTNFFKADFEIMSKSIAKRSNASSQAHDVSMDD